MKIHELHCMYTMMVMITDLFKQYSAGNNFNHISESKHLLKGDFHVRFREKFEVKLLLLDFPIVYYSPIAPLFFRTPDELLFLQFLVWSCN